MESQPKPPRLVQRSVVSHKLHSDKHRVTASVADVTARYADWLVRIIVQATAQQASPTVTPATLACALVADPRLGELLRTLYVYPPAYADPSAAYLAQVLATQTARTVDVL